MRVEELRWEYEPKEDVEFDFARNLHAVLKRPQGTLDLSIFSVKEDALIGPNRDYPYQGLCCVTGGEYWKYLDTLFFGLDGTELTPQKVVVYPWKFIYQYSGKNASLDVEFYLARGGGQGLNARALFNIRTSGEHMLTVKPLIDLRSICAESNPDVEIHEQKGGLSVRRGARKIDFFLPGCTTEIEKTEAVWRYKLGSGFREKTEGEIRFLQEYKHPYFVGEMKCNVNGDCTVPLHISCDTKKTVDFDLNEMKEMEYLQRLVHKFNTSKEVLTRIMALDSFGMMVDGIKVPEAGEYWFKQIWFRDLFEGCLSNFETYMKLNPQFVGKVLKWAVRKQDRKTGRMPDSYGGTNFEALDATLLFFLLTERYIGRTGDFPFAEKILNSLSLAFDELCRETQNGLLLSPPYASWIDCRMEAGGKKISDRVPSDWGLGTVLLPEINAQWIRALWFGVKLSEMLGRKEPKTKFLEAYEKAVKNYKKTFWNGERIYSAIGKKKDETRSSVGVVSAVLLKDFVFSENDLRKMWPSVKELIVKEDGKTFGIVVRKVGGSAYLDDRQYHGSVVWPRDLPYLVEYLRLIGKKKEAEEVLEKQLEHQMNEGAIFYNHELFSAEARLLPMKNPVQYWSQFCDLYLK